MSIGRDIVQYQLAGVDWPALRVVDAQPASDVPVALEELLAATSESEAEAAYWRLDNRVVVQGQLFNSAPLLVPALFAAVCGPITEIARLYVLDLLVEILGGESDQSEAVRGNGELGADVRRVAGDGLWMAYSLAADADASVRQRALFIIHAIDPDRKRVVRFLETASEDPDSSVRGFAAELRTRRASSG